SAKGEKAVAFSAYQGKIITDDAHTKARILKIDTQGILDELEKGNITVVAGFQGITPDNRITTLGRGGSDTTAVALAAALKADICEIYTDVEGVFTADPRIVPEARKLKRISYDEMLELASLGAKVLHLRAVEIAKKFRIPLHIRSSFSEEEGTLVN
ncbi:aspartate kinase, partial [Candidatus Aerophobetes bacterium]|nr:aspartate kinase [Candidatus Aerophobetes bacterium]